MMEVLFFAAVVVYFTATMLQAIGVALGRQKLRSAAFGAFATAFVLHTAFTVWRGIAAGRLPLANQFEFASGFAWSAAVMGIVLYTRMKQEWIKTVSMPVAFLVLSYAAFQPMEIKELMPALRSTWFALHIGSATFSYASFAIAGGLGAHYLIMLKKGHSEDETRMKQTDYMTYRLICLGFLLLTVVILSNTI